MSKSRHLSVRIDRPMPGLRIYRHNRDEQILGVAIGGEISDVWIAAGHEGRPLVKLGSVQTDLYREDHPDVPLKAALERQWSERLGCPVFVDWVKGATYGV